MHIHLYANTYICICININIFIHIHMSICGGLKLCKGPVLQKRGTRQAMEPQKLPSLAEAAAPKRCALDRNVGAPAFSVVVTVDSKKI